MFKVCAFIILTFISSYISHPYFYMEYNIPFSVNRNTFITINKLNILNNTIINFASGFDSEISYKLSNSLQLWNWCYLSFIKHALYLNSIGKVPTEAQYIFLSYIVDNLLRLKAFDFLPSDFFGNLYKNYYIIGKADFMACWYPNLQNFYCYFNSDTIQIIESNHETFKTSFNKLNNQVDAWVKSSSKIDDLHEQKFDCSDFYSEKNQIIPKPLDLVVKNEIDPQPYWEDYNPNVSIFYACTFGMCLSTVLFLTIKVTKFYLNT
jgi:hypothetical protein